MTDLKQPAPAASAPPLVQDGQRIRCYCSARPRLATCLPDALDLLAWAESEHRSGRFLVLQLYYELGEALLGIRAPQGSEGQPLVRIWSTDSPPELLDSLDRLDEGVPSGLLWPPGKWPLEGPMPSGYARQIADAQEAIRSGETYQINLTRQEVLGAYGSLPALYARLQPLQPTAHGGYLPASEGAGALLCFSPELFVEGCLPGPGRPGWAETRPMKGTLSAQLGDAQALSSDPKNRAENIMIVDLLRNDLGQLAEVGGVSVPSLFDVEKVGSVLQMTSTIRAELRPTTGLVDLLMAMFPCGSITGAPKRQTMKWIAELEPEPRGAYCGSMGWLDPDGRFSLNVVIRSLEERAPGQLHFGVGSGITIGSEAEAEWHECGIKAAFLRRLPSAVGLIETLSSEAPADRLAAHLSRLRGSAAVLGIPFDESEAYRLLQDVISEAKGPLRIRLALSPFGELTVSSGLLTPLEPQQHRAFWAADLLGVDEAQMQSDDPLLRHKTSRREVYDAGWQAAVAAGGFDAIFTNQRGEITEGGRSTVFVHRKGQWWTPPLASGVLPGILRQDWLEGRAFPDEPASEAILTPADLRDAEAVALVSSLRGRVVLNDFASLLR